MSAGASSKIGGAYGRAAARTESTLARAKSPPAQSEVLGPNPGTRFAGADVPEKQKAIHLEGLSLTRPRGFEPLTFGSVGSRNEVSVA